MNIELKEKQKVLNRNGWQARLYKFIWKKDPYNIRGWCPLFWISWLGLFLLPFVLLGEGVSKTLSLLKDFWPERLTKPEKEYEYTPCFSEIDYVYNLNEQEQDSFFKYTAFGGWAQKNPNWKEIYKARKDKEAENNRKIAELNVIRWERETARRAKLDAKMLIITKYAGYFVKPALAASAIFVGWLIWVTAAFLVSIITWKDIVISAQVLGSIALVIGAGYGIAKIIIKTLDLVQKTRKVIEPEKIEKIKEPGIFCKAGDAIYEALNFLIETVKMTYEKKCPLIQWGDETKPIEKIKKS